MKFTRIVFFALVFISLSCSSRRQFIGSSNRMADLSLIDTTQTITQANASDVLLSYIIDISIPNPLFGEAGSSNQSNDPSHPGTIDCRAVLLDDYSTEADILYNCMIDSLSDEACLEYRLSYEQDHVRDDMFRVLLAMESGFSDKSMEPEHWAFYIETPDGVMIEPADLDITPVFTVNDSIYSDYHKRNVDRRIKKRNMTFYFHKTTFFGEELLSGETPYLVFVISRNRETVARVAWKFHANEHDGD